MGTFIVQLSKENEAAADAIANNYNQKCRNLEGLTKLRHFQKWNNFQN